MPRRPANPRARTRGGRTAGARVGASPSAAETSRLCIAGSLAGFMAHEVNNHLAAALLELELSRDAEVSPAIQELLDRLHVAVESAGEVCRSTLGMLRPDQNAAQPGVVGEAVRRSVACLGRLRNRLVVELDALAAQCATPLSMASLQQVILNGVLNALRVTEGEVRLLVRFDSSVNSTTGTASQAQSRRRTGSTWNSGSTIGHRPTTNQDILISIEDGGPGMPDSLKCQLSSPPVPGTIQRIGTGGLGLSIMKHFVTSAQGTLHVSKAKPNGTRIDIRLPRVDSAVSRHAA